MMVGRTPSASRIISKPSFIMAAQLLSSPPCISDYSFRGVQRELPGATALPVLPPGVWGRGVAGQPHAQQHMTRVEHGLPAQFWQVKADKFAECKVAIYLRVPSICALLGCLRCSLGRCLHAKPYKTSAAFLLYRGHRLQFLKLHPEFVCHPGSIAAPRIDVMLMG